MYIFTFTTGAVTITSVKVYRPSLCDHPFPARCLWSGFPSIDCADVPGVEEETTPKPYPPTASARRRHLREGIVDQLTELCSELHKYPACNLDKLRYWEGGGEQGGVLCDLVNTLHLAHITLSSQG